MLYLNMYDYDTDKLIFAYNVKDVYGLLSKKISFTELIMLDVDALGNDVELISVFLDDMISKKINVISIHDRLVLHTEAYYLSRFEKTFFLSKVVKKQEENKKKTYMSINGDVEKKNKKIGAYCRVSSREQVQGYSIDNQKEKIQMYLELFDYEPEKLTFYVDEGKSASSLKRPAMQKMLKDIENDEIDEIIIYKLDRISRSVLDVYYLLNNLLSKDVNLVAILDNLDIKTANGRMVIGILAIFAQWERENTIERTNDGLLRMVREGKYPISTIPFGYRRDGEKYLYIYEKEAAVIRDMFLFAKSGYTFIEISRRLYEKHGYKLSDERVRNIIFNDSYFGEFLYKDFVFYEIVPAIVSKDDALEARKMSGKRNSVYGEGLNHFSFRYKVKCNSCGEILICVPTYKKDKHYYYYYCKKCKKRINQTKIVEHVLCDMILLLSKKSKSLNLEKRINKIKKLDKKIKQNVQDYIDDNIDNETYKVAMRQYNKQLKEAYAELSLVEIKNGMSWEDLSNDERRKIVEETISYMTIDLEKKEIVEIEYEK
ncbi:recombinase family protein [Amedibacterium intestinale]|uniref:recombinase family protein n=1 Tax=Amedibacterium intestinale TaxID=2583452 RepID=UPI000E20C5F3